MFAADVAARPLRKSEAILKDLLRNRLARVRACRRRIERPMSKYQRISGSLALFLVVGALCVSGCSSPSVWVAPEYQGPKITACSWPHFAPRVCRPPACYGYQANEWREWPCPEAPGMSRVEIVPEPVLAPVPATEEEVAPLNPAPFAPPAPPKTERPPLPTLDRKPSVQSGDLPQARLTPAFNRGVQPVAAQSQVSSPGFADIIRPKSGMAQDRVRSAPLP